MNHVLCVFNLALCAAAGGLCHPALAATDGPAPPAPGFLAAPAGAPAIRWQAVDDEVLSHQTGRYAGASMISGFVLNLLSQWHLPNGAEALAQGTLDVARNAANQLSATVNTLARVSNGNSQGDTGANAGAYAGGGQSVAVNGVSQITQVAGDRNLGSNAAQIDYSGQPAGAAPPGGSPATQSYAANAGGTIQAAISFNNGGVSVALKTPAGIATQTIAPGNTAQGGSIAQLLQIAGNNQQVTNQLQLHLQTQQMSPDMLRQAGVLQALQNIVRK